jgi:CRISPR/Cas system-associated exonuclease Cas4 (RecB family)
MKKMILTMAIAFSSFASFATNPVAAGEENISRQVLEAFNSAFTTVKDVVWTEGVNYYKASFVYNEKYVFAYYSMDGDLLGITRYISPADLPMGLQISLNKNSNGYWVSDLFEVAKNGTTSYYITLESADTKTVMKSAGGSDWEVYKAAKKS